MEGHRRRPVLSKLAVLCSVTLGLSAAQCATPIKPYGPVVENAAEWDSGTATAAGVREIIASRLGEKSRACTNFVDFACSRPLHIAGWPDRQVQARIWEYLANHTAIRRWRIIEETAQSSTTDPRSQRLRELYESCINTKARAPAAREAIRPLVDSLRGATSLAGLMRAVGTLQAAGVNTLFDIEIVPDPRAPGHYAAQLSQPQLTLGDAALYAQSDPLTEARLRHLRSTMKSTLDRDREITDLHADGFSAFDFEMSLAQISLPRAQVIDPRTSLSDVDLVSLKSLSDLPWEAYFSAIGLGPETRLTVAAPQYFGHLARLLAVEPHLEGARSYLAFAMLDQLAPFTTGWAPRQWQGCVAAADTALPDVVATAYKEKYGQPVGEATALVEPVRQALLAQLHDAEWLPHTDRTRLIAKVENIAACVGEVNAAPDCSLIHLEPTRYLANILTGRRMKLREDLARINKPVDRQRTSLSPFLATAVYDPTLNQVVVPLGLLQAPLVGPAVPQAVAYGAMGYLIAHEMAHSIDRIGRNYDARGGIAEPLSAQGQAGIAQHEACVRDAFATVPAAPRFYLSESALSLPAVTVSADRTLHETTADLTGLRVAWAAYKGQRVEPGQPEAAITGLTDDQLFFVAFAQLWCGPDNDGRMQLQAAYDTHAPDKARVNGLLKQVPEFAEAYQCPVGSPLRAEHVCDLW